MKICFYGDIANALNGKTSGGGELQIALLAKALAWGGHEVIAIDFFITKDFVSPDGIKVYAMNEWNNGLRVIRSLTHRLPQLYKCLIAHKADVYYCRIRDFRHIFAYWAAHKVNAKFILHMASDLDSMGTRMRLRNYKSIYLGSMYSWVNTILVELVYPWMHRKADLLLVQHEGQKNILLQRHIESTILFNLIDIDKIPVFTEQVHNDFIYVGGIDKRKGILNFLELVKKSPLQSFKVVGLPRDKTGSRAYKSLQSFGNVTLLGRLSHADTINQIANSKALISTSPMEGFPNIFVESWACGIPVLSLYVDPGGIIEKEKLGEVTHGNVDELLLVMDRIRNTDEFMQRAKAYVENNHTLNTNKIKEINLLFTELINH